MNVERNFSQIVTTAAEGNDETLDLKTELGTETRDSVLSLHQIYILEHLVLLLHAVLSTSGVVTNVVNVYAFLKLDWKESVTLTLFFLSLSDLTLSSKQVIKSVSILMELLEMKSGSPIFSVHPFALMIFSGTLGTISYTITMLITTFLAVTRCTCVAKPLHFKAIFTTKRTLYALLVFFLFPYVTYIPVFAEMGTVIVLDPIHNNSRPVLWVSERRRIVRRRVNYILFLALPILCQVLVTVSVFFLIAGLHTTSKFRNAMKAELNTKGISRNPAGTLRKNPDTLKIPGNLSGKELNVARQVILICTVFFITNIPAIGTAITQLVEHEFAMNTRYHDVYIFAYHMIMVSTLLNSCSTLFIYLKFNTAFRNLICGKKVQSAHRNR